jgi:hypothetical protein
VTLALIPLSDFLRQPVGKNSVPRPRPAARHYNTQRRLPCSINNRAASTPVRTVPSPSSQICLVTPFRSIAIMAMVRLPASTTQLWSPVGSCLSGCAPLSTSAMSWCEHRHHARMSAGLAVAIDRRVNLGLIEARLTFCFAERGFYFMPARKLPRDPSCCVAALPRKADATVLTVATAKGQKRTYALQPQLGRLRRLA